MFSLVSRESEGGCPRGSGTAHSGGFTVYRATQACDSLAHGDGKCDRVTALSEGAVAVAGGHSDGRRGRLQCLDFVVSTGSCSTGVAQCVGVATGCNGQDVGIVLGVGCRGEGRGPCD